MEFHCGLVKTIAAWGALDQDSLTFPFRSFKCARLSFLFLHFWEVVLIVIVQGCRLFSESNSVHPCDGRVAFNVEAPTLWCEVVDALVQVDTEIATCRRLLDAIWLNQTVYFRFVLKTLSITDG